MTDYTKYQSRGWLVLVLLPLLLSISTMAFGAKGAFSVVSENIVVEEKSGMMWRIDRSRRMKTPEDVNDYLQTLNKGQYSDWRLPNKQELFNIFSIFDLKQNGDVKLRLEGYYWLGADDGQPYVGTWEIGDQCGPSRTFYKGKAGYIRAVRP